MSSQIPLIRFTYPRDTRGRCVATYGNFNATIDINAGSDREPYRAELRHGDKFVGSRNHRSLMGAQTWLRELIKSSLEGATKFELADYATVDDLEGRFKRRAAQKARQLGLRIVNVTSSQTVLEKKATEIRTYHCLREDAIAEARRA